MVDNEYFKNKNSDKGAFAEIFTVINLIAGELLSSRAHVLFRFIV